MLVISIKANPTTIRTTPRTTITPYEMREHAAGPFKLQLAVSEVPMTRTKIPMNTRAIPSGRWR